MRRLVFLLVFLSASVAAQFTPQLEAFAGSRANLASLASGLETGNTVMLSTITDDGMREEMMFTPARPMPADQREALLQAARARLLERGIASPTPRQIGAVLMGGTLFLGKGAAQLPAMIAAVNPDKPLMVSVHNFAGSSANYRNLLRGLTRGTTITLADPADRHFKVSFTPLGSALSPEEAKHTLLMASELLASSGIYDPTLDEVRSALIGGIAEDARGRKVVLRGVLEGRNQ